MTITVASRRVARGRAHPLEGGSNEGCGFARWLRSPLVCPARVRGRRPGRHLERRRGKQGKPPAGTPKGTSLNQFFPGRLTVNAGDKVTFATSGSTPCTYLAGKPFPAFLGPAKGEVYEGISDSTGQPFFFDGEQKFIYNAAFVAKPFGPKVIAGKPASSGPIPAQSPKKPVKVTYGFPKVGKFKLLCLIHPKMEMTVTVKPKGAAVETPEAVAAKARRRRTRRGRRPTRSSR